MEDIKKIIEETWEQVVQEYEQDEEEEKSYSPSNPWDAPGMSIKDFI